MLTDYLVTHKFANLFSSNAIPMCADLASPTRTTVTANSTSPNVVLGGLVRDAHLDMVFPSRRISKLDDDDGIEDTSSTEPSGKSGSNRVTFG